MYQKLITLARQNANFEAKNVHVSILTHKNKVISVGRNDYNKTSSAFVDFYRETHNRIHSEMDCIKRARNYRHLSKCALWNFRFARKNNGLLLSMPCNGCMQLINLFDIKQVYFTTPYGVSEL
jgi:tRNA(Arg) A34 adenosine deaminase TadA